MGVAGGRAAPARQAPRAVQQRATQQRRAVRQRQALQQRRAVQARRTQQRGADLRRHLELLRQQRVWQRTTAKRAARQVETEEAILEREARLRAARVEPPRYARKRETYAEYVRRRTAEAHDATLAAANHAAALDGIWAAAKASPLHVSFGSLRRRATAAPFDANGLDVPLPAPRAEDFQPGDGHLPAWVPGQRTARERARAAAYAEYRQAVADHRAAEFDRVRRLSLARLSHQRREVAARAEVDAHNAAVDRLRAGYRERSPAAVEEFARIVLSTRPWPDGVVLRWRLRYRPDFAQIDAECVLPRPGIVPSVRRYRYVAAADAIRRQFAPPGEVRDRYNRMVAQIALVAVFDLFSGLAADVVEVVQLSGRLPDGGPHVVSLAAARAEWEALRPWTDPAATLRRLDARVSPDAYAGVPVTPWADIDAD
jgi:restriction system protein